MPNGGQIPGASAGLRLQPASPGVKDVGNANISGSMIAANMTTNPSGAQAVNGAAEIFGHNNVCPNKTTQSNVIVGSANTTANGNTGTYVIFGYSNQATGQSNVAMGISNVAGPNPATGFAHNVAIGDSCEAGNTATDGGNRVALGYNCQANGDTNIAIGRSVAATNTKAGNGDIIAFGADVSCGLGAQKNQLFGDGIGPTGAINVTVVGGWGAGGGAPAWPGVASNTVMIGNSAQTIIRLGSLTLTKLTASGSRGGNAALASLLTQLSTMGLINDTTTA